MKVKECDKNQSLWPWTTRSI